ncbi:Uncharacterised protein [Enterococcus durans]|uniref:Uncharacterized protein n=1 Tax=Enterococcus durans TaxID=53345 RepID=A0A377MQ13_9ENTE|nr:hypothetical protein [Enterococcus durans]STQ33041.1 Uncharacterised protein [Enterococcus durans]
MIEKLDNLASLFAVLEKQNSVFEQRTNSYSTQLTDTQLALTEVYETVIGGEKNNGSYLRRFIIKGLKRLMMFLKGQRRSQAILSQSNEG